MPFSLVNCAVPSHQKLKLADGSKVVCLSVHACVCVCKCPQAVYMPVYTVYV